MTAVATPETPAEPMSADLRSYAGSSTNNLASALIAFQKNLPGVNKSRTATVRSDKGNYSYNYADLAVVSAVVLPALAHHGLSFSACPTVTDDGKFVLRYTLLHISGDEKTGSYPLPAPGVSPQAMGSAITYARRYCLCAVTGVAPENDDDDAAAAVRTNERSSRDGDGARQPTKELLATVATTSSALQELSGVGDYVHFEGLVKFAHQVTGVDITKKQSEDGAIEEIDWSVLSSGQLHQVWVRLDRRLKEETVRRDGVA